MQKKIEAENAAKKVIGVKALVENIEVKFSSTMVTFTGTVNSWYQKDEAGRIAWKTPGIWHVKNELAVDYYYALID